MRKSRYTEEQIIQALKQHEAKRNTTEICRFIGAADLVHQFTLAEETGALDEALSHFARHHRLIVDELGYLLLAS